MVSASVAFDLLPELVSTFDPAVSTMAGQDVIVIDGDKKTSESGTFLYVGWDDPESNRSTSVDSAQPWVGLGGRVQDEEGTITCYVVRTVGDPDVAAAREAIRGVVDAVKTILRADPNLGGRVPGLQTIRFGQRFQLTQWITQTGAVALCTFELAYEARI